jgi:hypothetical protein
MNKNKYYGFDEDVEIDYTDVFIDAIDKKEAAEKAARQETLHDDAVDLIMDKIVDFFRYFEVREVMEYVNEAFAAKQILLSLTESGHVPPELILDAARKLETNIHLRIGTKLMTSTKRKHIVSKLIQYLENRRLNPQSYTQNLEFEPLPNVPTVVEPNN